MSNLKRKNVTSAKTENKCDHSGYIGLLVLLAAAITVLGIILFVNEPNFEYGNCLLNRAGQTVQVREVGERFYEIVYMEYHESYSGWITSRNYDKYPENREIDYIDEHYIEVPCER